MKNYLYIVFSIVFISVGRAQIGSLIIDKNEIFVGQQVGLTYHLTLENGQEINFKPFLKSIPIKRNLKENEKAKKENIFLEITTSFIDTIIVVNGKREWFGSYSITGWDEGSFTIPNTSVIIDNKKVDFPNAILKVKLVKAIKGKDIYDIKESFTKIPDAPFSLKQFYSDYKIWIYSILALLLVVFLYFKWKKKANVIEKIKELTLKEKTILAIENLDKLKMWSDGRLKEHYVELSFIMRSYLSSLFEINLLEKTTHESKILLTQKGLNKEVIGTIVEILDLSDMVKFAKSSPEEITAIRFSVISKQVVEITSQLEENNV